MAKSNDAITPQADISVAGLSAKDRLAHLMTFLEREVESEEQIQMAKMCFDNSETQLFKNKKKVKTEQEATAAGLLSVKEAKSQRCLFCEENHDSSNCDRARNMDMDERTKIVKDKNACFKCLRIGTQLQEIP